MSKIRINEIIRDEIDNIILEACGCVAAPSPVEDVGVYQISPETQQGQIPWMGQDVDPMLYEPPSEQLNRAEALDRVEKIAQVTSCPVTQHALQHLVDSLRSAEGGEEEVYVSDVGSLDSDEAFGLGRGMGSGEIVDYNVSG